LRRIGNYAFSGAHLEAFEVPANVEVIGEECFHECVSLCKLTFEHGSKLQRLDIQTFEGTMLEAIKIPSSVEFIGESCFCECKDLYEVTFEQGSKLRNIGKCAFAETKLRRLDFPRSVDFIGESCFSLAQDPYPDASGSGKPSKAVGVGELGRCVHLHEITFEKGSQLRRIGDCAFAGTTLERVEIPRNVEYIGRWCFCECRVLHEMNFECGSKLLLMGKGAFQRTMIQKLEIPSSVEFIGKWCFFGCVSLKEVVFEGNAREFADRSFARGGRYDAEPYLVKIPYGIEMNYEFPSCCRVVRYGSEGSDLDKIASEGKE
jgi:hypothetical protein